MTPIARTTSGWIWRKECGAAEQGLARPLPPNYPPANPTGGNGPSDMELLMAEFVRLDVDSDEVS